MLRKSRIIRSVLTKRSGQYAHPFNSLSCSFIRQNVLKLSKRFQYSSIKFSHVCLYLVLSYRSEEHTSELQSQFHLLFLFFFFNTPAPPEISPLPLHDALPI